MPTSTGTPSHTKLMNDLANNMAARRSRVSGETSSGTVMEEPGVFLDPKLKWFGEPEPTPDDPNKLTLAQLTGRDDLGEVGGQLLTYYSDDCYTDEQKEDIPAVSSTYRANTKALSDVAYTVDNVFEPVVLLVGNPGTGKSSLAQYLAAIQNRPFVALNFNEEMDTGQIIGSLQAPDGTTEFIPGILTQALLIPNAIVALEEWTTIQAGIMFVLQRVLEKGGKLMLPDKEGKISERFITPAENVAIILTDNTRGQGDMTGRMVGTQPQNAATLDRIDTFIEVEYMPAEEEINALLGIYPTAKRELVECMVEVARLSRVALEQGSLATPFTFRVLMSWIQHALNLRDYERGLYLSFIERLDDPTERETVLSFVTTVFGHND